jgi:hypothetical protein
LRGQTTEMTVRHRLRGQSAAFDTHWKLLRHESFAVGGQNYDTLVFDLTETNSRNAIAGVGRLWYAPALGLFVRRLWRPANSNNVTGYSVIGVSANVGDSGGARGSGGP